MLNAFDDALFGSDAVCVSVTARHGYCRLNDIAVVRGREKFGDLYFISHLYQPLSFHFKPFLSHDKPPPVSDIPAGIFSGIIPVSTV